MNRVDMGVTQPVGLGQASREGGQGVRDKASEGGTTDICEDAWYEWIAVANYVYRTNPDADIYDVFNWIRENIQGGSKFSEAVLKRADREVATECGPW